MRALVIGGGIGGLAAAIGLRRAGVEVAVFERAGDLRQVEIGAGVHLWSNTLRALGRLGLEDEIAAVGSETKRFEYKNWQERLLARWDVASLSDELGSRTYGVARPDLHRTLATAVGDGVVRTGARCVGYEQDDSGVTARFEDGSEERGDVLIGADGTRSAVRAQLLGSQEPRYAGVTSWRGIVPEPDAAVEQGLFELMCGSGRLFILYTVGGGRPYWLAIANSPSGERDPEGRSRETVLSLYEGWPERISATVAKTDESAITRADLYDRDPIKQWSEGRVTLLGDAAHAMTPHLGQGAGMSIEDAVVLATCLGGAGDIPAALREYQERRRKRAGRTQGISRKIGHMLKWSSPSAMRFRDTLMRATFPTMIWRAQRKDLDVQL